jgi:hypothetical protein
MIKFTNKFQAGDLMYYFTDPYHLLQVDSTDNLMTMATVVINIKTNMLMKCRYPIKEILDSLVVPMDNQAFGLKDDE